MIFPDFIPTWARDWYSWVTNDCGDGCTRILQRDAALRLVTDSTMKKVYESLSRLNLTSDVLKEILNQASWCADISWEDTRDSCRKMNQRKQNLEKSLRVASDELSAMEDEEGDGGAVPFVLASLPALFRAMGLDSVTDKGSSLRDHLDQIANAVANSKIDLPATIAPGVVSQKTVEFASFVRSFEGALQKQVRMKVPIPVARVFDLAVVALPAQFAPKRYSKNKNPEDYKTDAQKSAMIISIRKTQV